jgi:hypothetical protein
MLERLAGPNSLGLARKGLPAKKRRKKKERSSDLNKSV